MIRTSMIRLCSAAALFAVIATASPAGAQTQVAAGKPSVFKVTVTKVELFNGTSYVTVFTGTSTLDLVAAAGASSFPGVANLTLPAGTYSKVRVTFANNFGLQGSLAYGGVTYYTTSTAVTGSANGAAVATADPASAGESTIVNPLWGALNDPVVQEMTITPVTVSSTTTYAPTLKFDVTSSLTLWVVTAPVYYFTLAPPTITLQ